MARSRKFTDPTDIEICEVHRQFVQVMENVRLETISTETKAGWRLRMPRTPWSAWVSRATERCASGEMEEPKETSKERSLAARRVTSPRC